MQEPGSEDGTIKLFDMAAVEKTVVSYRGRLVPLLWIERIPDSNDVFVHIESERCSGRCAGPISKEALGIMIPILADAMAIVGGYNGFGGTQQNMFNQIIHTLGSPEEFRAN